MKSREIPQETLPTEVDGDEFAVIVLRLLGDLLRAHGSKTRHRVVLGDERRRLGGPSTDRDTLAICLSLLSSFLRPSGSP